MAFSKLRRLTRWMLRPVPILICIVIGAAAFVGGRHLYAWYQLRAGKDASQRYRSDSASRHFQNSLSVWPKDAEVLLLLSRSAWRQERFNQAEEYLDRCRQFANETLSPRIAFEWALSRAAAGNLIHVEPYLLVRLRKDAEASSLILEALANGYRRVSRVTESLRILQQWLALEPTNVQAHFQLAELHRQLGAVAKAATNYKRVLDLDPERIEAQWWLAMMLRQHGRCREALAILEKLKGSRFDNNERAIYIAFCKHHLGQVAEAERIFESITKKEPKNGLALRTYGRLLFVDGRYDKAGDLLRRAAKQLPFDYQTHWALYQLMQKQKRFKEAAHHRSIAQKLKDNYERLSEIQSRLIPKNPFDAKLHHESGTIYFSIGQEENAQRWFLSALQVAPNFRPAHVALARYYASVKDQQRAAYHSRRAAQLLTSTQQ